MKKSLLTGAMMLAFGCTAFAQVPTNGLVGYWPFDGDANDYSGNNNNGTVYGASLIADRFGVANRAYGFDGVSAHILVPNASTIDFSNSSDFTISFWIKTFSDNIGGTPLSKANYGSFSGYQFFSDSQNSGYCHSPGAFSFYTASGAQQDACADNGICDDYTNWYFVTATYHGSANQSTLYINTVAQADIGMATGTISNTSPLSFGSEATGHDFFSGALDGVRIYNRILNSSEIAALYNEGTTGINEVQSGYSNLSVFPNPATDAVKLSFTSKTQQAATVKIIDNLGKTVYSASHEVMQGSNEIQVKTGQLPAGIYTVQLSSASGQFAKRISIAN